MNYFKGLKTGLLPNLYYYHHHLHNHLSSSICKSTYILSYRRIYSCPTLLESNSKSKVNEKIIPEPIKGRDDAITPHDCWGCHKKLNRSAIVCKGCKKIQPLYEEAKYFDVMLPKTIKSDELDWRYDVDLKNIKKNYLKIQQFIHPDAWVKSPEPERSFSEQQSIFINKAYATYSTPLARSMYLLEQHGIPLEETDKAQDQYLLMSIVEYQEEIEDIEELVLQQYKGNKLACKEYLRISNEVNHHVTDAEEKLSEAWSIKNLDLCKSLTIELKYWTNLKTMIDTWVPGTPLRVEH